METGCISLAGKRAGLVMRFERCWNERCTSFSTRDREKKQTTYMNACRCGFSQRRVSGCTKKVQQQAF